MSNNSLASYDSACFTMSIKKNIRKISDKVRTETERSASLQVLVPAILSRRPEDAIQFDEGPERIDAKTNATGTERGGRGEIFTDRRCSQYPETAGKSDGSHNNR